MKAIKDSVHDHIPICDLAADLLDTPELQRLRHIKQLSTVRLVYPSANHTRFEHSLGVYYLAREALSLLGVEGHRAKAVRAAALLHDVGHGPYGHQTEGIIQRRLGRHHDEVGDLLGEGRLAAVLESHGLDPDEVAALVAGEGRLGQLVAGELDVDRMDYLVRDAHHTGVPYGTIDHSRLLAALQFRDGDLVLSEGNVQTAEGTLVARALMNATVYRHHVSRIAGAMLERAGERLLDADERGSSSNQPEADDAAEETSASNRTQSDDAADLDISEFARMTDDRLLAALRNCEATADAARRLERRSLYKRAVWAKLDAVPESVVAADREEARAFEREIAAVADVTPEDVLVDTPGEPSMPETSTRVVADGEVRRLADESPLVEGLRAAGRAQWRLGVYAPEEKVPEVGAAAERVLGIDP